MDRRSFLKQSAASIAAGAAGMSFSAAGQQASRPNIVLIMADDLGYGHLGCYGQAHIRTPHLDRLAESGVRFTNAYAGCPQCAPSRSVLMTGLHAGHTPVRGNSGGIPLSDDDLTFAEVLQDAGYRTGLFGKWGLGEAGTTGVPNKQGFNEFFGYLHQKHAHFYYTDYLWHNEEKYPLPGNANGQRGQYSHDVVMDKAIEFMGEENAGPFFCFLSLSIPHHEWTVPDESLREYSGQFDEDPPEYEWRAGYATPQEPKANMAAMITHMDKGVGRVMAMLEEQGKTENTLVIFTSDNGADSYSLACADFFEANGDLRGYKYDMYEGGIRVPAIAHWPGHIRPGVTSDSPWYFADLFPAFAELAGATASIPEDIDGVSITPLFAGGDVGPALAERFMYWEAGGRRAGRWKHWKIVRNGDHAPIELYDLRNDSAEERNVASVHADVAARLERMLDENHQPARPQIEPDAPDGRYYR